MNADELFRSALERRGLLHTVDASGLYEVHVHGQIVNVSLEDIRRNYERDGDGDAIVRFVEQINAGIADLPTWEEARPYVRYSLETLAGYEDTSEVLHDAVGETLEKVYVITTADGGQITWVTPGMLSDWHIDRDALTRQADENMARVTRAACVECQEIEGVQIGMLATSETPFKAALILARSFRDLVHPTHGWPVYVVAPCRDFVYFVAQKDMNFLARLGQTVLREYRESGYPVTRDVLEVSDEGLATIGTFGKDPDSETA